MTHSTMLTMFCAALCVAVTGTTLAFPLPARTPAPVEHRTGEAVVSLTLSDGRPQRVLVTRPDQAKGSIVMLPGGEGDVGIERDGDLRHGHNFVVRTRRQWNARGYAVVIPDTVEGENLRGQRSSPAYARVVGDLVAFARKTAEGPVFVLGTSQGAIAAMNGAAHAPRGSVAGVVLTESVSVRGGSGETVFDADPAAVRVPALVVANRDDRCDVAPPSAAPGIAAAMTNSPDVRVMYVSGGRKRSTSDCGSLTPHGYDGIEDKVVDGIADWLDAHRR
jgi:hypothetical protein